MNDAIENFSIEQPKRMALEAARTRAVRKGTARAATHRRDLPIAFCYLRVSTKEQARTGGGAEGYSIPAQRQACYLKAEDMGAVVAHEYVDAGESAKTAHRPELQAMLTAIKTVRPDYVIVHKIDRLARNREDDIAINLMLKKYGVKLVSCSENIDDTPSGRLLYGLMAEIAQFYSGNLALEVMKGLVRKAEEGGTPFRAPLGYVNCRESRGGASYSWVELDPERADIICWCFEQYSTGEWSAIDLTLAARVKGLTSRPTPTKPAQPISLTTMYHILSNPYYMGVVSYQGVHYEGKHPTLVEPETWLVIQDILAAHAHTGEKDRVHTHYLRSTIYCSSCGGRLVYSENKGNGGTYTYFVCVKKKTKLSNCTRPSIRVERIEDGIAAFYTSFQPRPEHVAQIQTAVSDELAAQQNDAHQNLDRATKRKTQLQEERQKLLQAHYAGAIPQDLLGSEMQRLTRSLIDVDSEIVAAKATTTEVEATLAAALRAATRCASAYLTASGPIRRQINQGFFQKLFISEDGSVQRAELTEPFTALLDTTPHDGTIETIDSPSQDAVDATESATADDDAPHCPSAVLRTMRADVTERENVNTPRFRGRGVNDEYLVGRVGLEPTAKGL
jgi:site-specific DNA recombinase